MRSIQPSVYVAPPLLPAHVRNSGLGVPAATEPTFEWQIEHWTEWHQEEYVRGEGYKKVKKVGSKSTMTVYAPTEADAYAKVDAAFTLSTGHTRKHRVVDVNEVRP